MCHCEAGPPLVNGKPLINLLELDLPATASGHAENNLGGMAPMCSQKAWGIGSNSNSHVKITLQKWVGPASSHECPTFASLPRRFLEALTCTAVLHLERLAGVFTHIKVARVPASLGTSRAERVSASFVSGWRAAGAYRGLSEPSDLPGELETGRPGRAVHDGWSAVASGATVMQRPSSRPRA